MQQISSVGCHTNEPRFACSWVVGLKQTRLAMLLAVMTIAAAKRCSKAIMSVEPIQPLLFGSGGQSAQSKPARSGICNGNRGSAVSRTMISSTSAISDGGRAYGSISGKGAGIPFYPAQASGFT